MSGRRDRKLQMILMVRSKGLWAGPKYPFELPAEMRLGDKVKLRCGRVARIPLRDQILCEPTLQLAQTALWRAPELALEQPL